MNWGKKILIFYLTFVVGIMFLVVKSMRLEQDLVTTDYYEQELKYQQRIEERGRADALKHPLIISKQLGVIAVAFQEELSSKEIKGDVWIYCANDKQKDLKQTFQLQPQENNLEIKYTTKGNRIIKVSWECEGVKYYYEEKINL